jgi:hypothetical protein
VVGLATCAGGEDEGRGAAAFDAADSDAAGSAEDAGPGGTVGDAPCAGVAGAGVEVCLGTSVRAAAATDLLGSFATPVIETHESRTPIERVRSSRRKPVPEGTRACRGITA